MLEQSKSTLKKRPLADASARRPAPCFLLKGQLRHGLFAPRAPAPVQSERKLVLKEVHRVLRPAVSPIFASPPASRRDLLFAFLQFVSIHLFRYRDPIPCAFTASANKEALSRPLLTVRDNGPRVPAAVNIHTRWTWHYILVPKRFHATLRRLSDRIEAKANGRIPFLKHFGVTLMVKVVK